ncbi:hypothetical protein PIB30_101990 [Stylosanthes scabra]|uniref:Putative plant transposon protein domain-containing protein n=1 Tax=Stylosanthes scabra TaxID=79078 RepID=A0ABU6X088_9FABA|nr:hypothetical protein [Stylosanthes scabra]
MRGTHTLPPHTSSHPTKPTISHNTPYHPRICVQSCAYAWHTHCTSPIPLTSPLHYVTHAYASPRTHMRGQLTTHFLAPTHATIYVPISHTYAYNPTHMRGTTTLNFTFQILTPPSPTHMRTTLCICVEPSTSQHAYQPTQGMSTHRPLLCVNTPPKPIENPTKSFYPILTLLIHYLSLLTLYKILPHTPISLTSATHFHIKLLLSSNFSTLILFRSNSFSPLPPTTATSNSFFLLISSPFLTTIALRAFNEELYNTIVKNKKVIAECYIDLDEDEYPEVKEQIALRGWRRLAAPKQKISIDLIHEFYANAVVTEEEMEEAGGHTFRSFVRGVPVDFSPENIRTVMRFRAQVQGATTDFETRKEHDQQLDRVLADLCMPGATWKLSTGQLRVPI